MNKLALPGTSRAGLLVALGRAFFARAPALAAAVPPGDVPSPTALLAIYERDPAAFAAAARAAVARRRADLLDPAGAR